jgi:hypothetical protein
MYSTNTIIYYRTMQILPDISYWVDESDNYIVDEKGYYIGVKI